MPDPVAPQSGCATPADPTLERIGGSDRGQLTIIRLWDNSGVFPPRSIPCKCASATGTDRDIRQAAEGAGDDHRADERTRCGAMRPCLDFASDLLAAPGARRRQSCRYSGSLTTRPTSSRLFGRISFFLHRCDARVSSRREWRASSIPARSTDMKGTQRYRTFESGALKRATAINQYFLHSKMLRLGRRTASTKTGIDRRDEARR